MEDFQMKKYFVAALFVICSVSANSQVETSRFQELESRVTELESKLEDQNSLVRLLSIEAFLNGYRTILSLSLNRNFTYFGYLNKGESIKNSDGTEREVYYFTGYHSLEAHNNLIEADRGSRLDVIRGNMRTIRNIIVDNDFYGYDGKSKNQLIIEYYDNVSSSNTPHIVGDIDKNSLKVRINGVLTEIGWE